MPDMPHAVTFQPTGRPLRLQVNVASRHVAMLDRLAVDIRVRHGVAMSRTGILRAIVEAAERDEWEAVLFGSTQRGSNGRYFFQRLAAAFAAI
jgi:hypothetical protein